MRITATADLNVEKGDRIGVEIKGQKLKYAEKSA